MKQALVARADLGMGAGKLAAQVAHASVSAYERADEEARRSWRADGAKKVVLRAEDEAALGELADHARRSGLPVAVITDAGRTELAPGTVTAVGIGPAAENDIDRVTGALSLW